MAKNLEDLGELMSGIRDISDFCEKWPELERQFNQNDITHLDIEPELKTLFIWLIKLASRVCPGP